MKLAKATIPIALALRVVGCATSGRVGMNVASVSAALTTEDLVVVDGIALAATAQLASIDLHPTIRKALSRASQRARTLPPDFAEVVASLESLQESHVALSWSPDPFPFQPEHILASSVTCSASSGPHRLDGETVFRGEVAVQVVPWPRKPGFTHHPELLLCHASVEWYTEIAGGFLLAEAIAQELARATAGIISRVAEDASVGTRRIKNSRTFDLRIQS